MRAGARRWWAATAALSLVVHLVALYWPVVTVAGPVTWTDKAVHVLLFAVPTYFVGRVVARPLWAVIAFAVHSVVSELSQHLLLPGRSGDPWDVVADIAGVTLGALALVVRGRSRR
jgi:hypothetical protein